jgi:hypothetical protein
VQNSYLCDIYTNFVSVNIQSVNNSSVDTSHGKNTSANNEIKKSDSIDEFGDFEGATEFVTPEKNIDELETSNHIISIDPQFSESNSAIDASLVSSVVNNLQLTGKVIVSSPVYVLRPKSSISRKFIRKTVRNALLFSKFFYSSLRFGEF